MLSTLLILAALAQGPGREPTLSKAADVEDLVQRMTAFDKNGDGELTKDEITDARLLGLFTRADADGDGVVTKAELTTLGEAEHSDTPDFDFGPGPGGPPPGFDGRPGPGGPPPGFGRPPIRPGEILPDPIRQTLELTPEQRKKLDELQAKVDAELAEILTDTQRERLKTFADRPGRPFAPPPR